MTDLQILIHDTTHDISLIGFRAYSIERHLKRMDIHDIDMEADLREIRQHANSLHKLLAQYQLKHE